MALTDLADIVD